ncbi:MAG: hypothetical protein ACKERG_00500 [Candidatus Hodgkinia cicadicola]
MSKSRSVLSSQFKQVVAEHVSGFKSWEVKQRRFCDPLRATSKSKLVYSVVGSAEETHNCSQVALNELRCEGTELAYALYLISSGLDGAD